jgi:hypothetical protein
MSFKEDLTVLVDQLDYSKAVVFYLPSGSSEPRYTEARLVVSNEEQLLEVHYLRRLKFDRVTKPEISF